MKTRILILAAVLLMLAALLLRVERAEASAQMQAGPAASGAPTLVSPWTRYQLTGSTLSDVDALSANDAWATGGDGVAAHWDGATWTTMDMSDIIGAQSVQFVDMLATNDVFAYSQGDFLRYNGAGWSVLPSSVATNMNEISMLSATDGWAAGLNARFARWNGTTWSEVTASASVTETMYGIDMLATNEGWAVGGTTIPNVGQQGKIARWNGSSWDAVSSPVNNRIFYAVDFSAANEGWAVGSGGTTLHWTGSAWTLVPPPPQCALSCGAVTLRGVYSVSPTDAWAVGSTNGWTSNTWHWDGTGWTELPTPTGAPLNGVMMLSGTDGWSVGDRGTIYRWNGTSWTISNSHWLTNGLYALDFIAPNDGWAVGVLNQSTPPAWGLQRWNGSTWTEYQPPTFSPGPMRDVDMLATDQVWAVGSQAIFFWNGSTWTSTTSTGNFMDALSMVSPTDGWAVGTGGDIVHFNGTSWTNYTTPTTTNLWSIDMVDANEGWAGGTLGLMLHYQNGVWTQVTPNPGQYTIEAIQMLNANEGWAVGYNGQILHYLNGTWSQVASPVSTNLLGIHMIDANEGWAVGVSPTGGTAAILHYQNGTWSQVQSPTRNNLRDVFVSPNGQGWAVSESPGTKLYLGSISGGTPTPTPTGGVATSTPTVTRTFTSIPSATSTTTPTRTPTGLPATGTPTNTSTGTPLPLTNTPSPTITWAPTWTPVTLTATPTSCAIQFTDVDPNHTFYPFIRCLACRGIINGYTSGCSSGNPCFRPENNVTRGQVAKIVSNAAGFSDPITNQSFEDVPVGSTFHEFVGRLAMRGIVGGYACGGTGEPCNPPLNLPYFRPNANVTRGQLAKMDSEAAGYSDVPSGQQFEDVAQGSTFYTYTYRLAIRTIMSGYACGGVGEPCNPPLNLPYFRPGNPATRGQTAKIVANTFYPNCNTPQR